MNNEDIFMATILLLMTLSMVGLMAYLFVGLGDSFSLRDIATQSVPCMDEYNRPFENEMCTKTITCSKLGVAGDRKCDVKGGLDE